MLPGYREGVGADVLGAVLGKGRKNEPPFRASAGKENSRRLDSQKPLPPIEQIVAPEDEGIQGVSPPVPDGR